MTTSMTTTLPDDDDDFDVDVDDDDDDDEDGEVDDRIGVIALLGCGADGRAQR